VGHEGAMELASTKYKTSTLTPHFMEGMAFLKIVCKMKINDINLKAINRMT
jgi:hypothetical protein